MSDMDVLLKQPEGEDEFSELPSDQRKQMYAKMRVAYDMNMRELPILMTLRQQWESAPVGSLWKKALCKQIDTIQTACIDAMREAMGEITAAQAAVAAIKERKAKDKPTN
jgi:hypothetical protein